MINEKWVVGQKLGSGSFGDIFLASEINSGELVAVKMEDGQSKHPQLIGESKILKFL